MKWINRHITIGWTLSLVLLALAACKGPEVLTQNEVKDPVSLSEPSWVKQRPINSAYYIGIGSASKLREPLDFQQVAKKNALNDLSSEIRVRVQGETFLNTLDQTTSFQEEFRAQITTSVLEDIQDFEIVDSYETSNDYWVYYRLSKAEHARIKKQRKDAAMNASYDLYTKGQDAIKNGNFPAGVDMHIRALLELKEYWDEVNEYLTAEGMIYLDNSIYNDLRALLSELDIQSDLSEVVLSIDNGFKTNLNTQVVYKGEPVRGIDVNYHYDRAKYSRPAQLKTDAQGSVAIPIRDINLESSKVYAEIWLNVMDLLADDLDQNLSGSLLKGIPERRLQVPIRMEYPKVQVTSTEVIFGESARSARLKNGMADALSSRGFTLVPSSSQADLIVDIDGEVTQGGTSQGFHVAFLDMSIRVKDPNDGSELFSQSFTKLKGLQLNFDAAAVEAMKKGIDKLEKESSKELINKIL